MNATPPLDARPIGVFDSGIGGLTVYRELRRHVPRERLLYFGDTARLPYGTKSGETVVRFTLEAAEFLREQGVRALVVACNTASAYAIPALEERLGLPVEGVIRAGARAAADATRGGAIGVIGTSATIASRAYERALGETLPGARVFARACPLLVPLVEEGWIDHPVTGEVAREYLAPLAAEEIDTLILGCTHYPLLAPVIQRVVGTGVRLVDASRTTAVAVARRLGIEPEENETTAAGSEPEHRIFLTDLPRAFRQTSERFLGRPLPPVEIVARDEERWVRA